MIDKVSALISGWRERLDLAARRYFPDADAERARSYARRIQRELDRMGISYRGKGRRGRGEVDIVELIQFIPPLVVLPSSIRLYVDTRVYPTGVKLSRLTDPDVIDTLSSTLEKEVMVVSAPKLYYEIFSDSLVRGIPKRVWADAVTVPADASPLTYPVGVSRRGVMVADLHTMPHFLVAGATQQGKSVHLWHMIVSLASRNSPQQMKLILFDLKDNAVTFSPFRNLPHMLLPVIDSPEKCIPAFETLRAEMEERYRRIGGRINFDGYNASAQDKLPYMVVVIDELASITLKKSLFKGVEENLGELLRKAAGCGMHFIVATQYPTTDVLTRDVKANIPEAMVFRCNQHHHSTTAIGKAGAEKLPGRGRAILKLGADYIELQTPLIEGGSGTHGIYTAISAIVQKWAAEGTTETKAVAHDDRLEQDLINYAVNFLGGKFNINEIYRAFRGRGVTRKQIMVIGQQLERDGILSPGRPGRSRVVCSCSVPHQNASPQGELPMMEQTEQTNNSIEDVVE